MTMRLSLATWFGIGLILLAAPHALFAQGTTGSSAGASTGGTTSTSSGGLNSGAGGTSYSSSSSTSSSITTTVTPKGVRSSAGSGTSIPSSTNPFATTYVDYLTLGKASLYQNTGNPIAIPTISTGTFGQPIYGNVTSAKGGAGAGGVGAQSTATGFSTVGTLRAPAYITSLSSEIPFAKHSATSLLVDARAVIEQSSYINNKERIEVTVNDAGVVLLRGQVGTEKERRVAETTLRITPGVRDVQNLLVVVDAK